MPTLDAYLTRSIVFGNVAMGGQTTLSGDGVAQYSKSLTAAENPTINPFSFDGDELVLFGAIASVDMTLTPDAGPVINLEAGVLYQWSNDSGLANPFVGVTVTEIVVTNVLAGDLNIYVLSNV